MIRRLGGGIRPENIPELEYDYICISSSKYFQKIKKVINIIDIENENKMFSLYNVFADFRNYELRDQWVIAKLNKILKGKILLDARVGEQKYKSYCIHLKYIV